MRGSLLSNGLDYQNCFDHVEKDADRVKYNCKSTKSYIGRYFLRKTEKGIQTCT